MAIYRTVHMSFWTDTKVDDDFTQEDKYFYLYLLTNPHTNLCGCYEISMGQMVRETGYNEDTVKRLLQRMETVHGVIQYDPKTKEIYIPRWGKYNWVNSKDTDKGIAKAASLIKSERFRIAFTEMGYIDPVQGVYRGPIGPVGVSVTDTVTDTDTVKSKHPTLDEVKAYCQERGNRVDPERFIDYYTANGWKVGKNPMKDWKAAVRTWERQYTQKARTRNTLLNYDEKGRSHASVKEIELDLEEL